MDKHTPGPWDTNGLRIWAKFAYSDSQAFELATMSHFVPCTEREATARVMAASPELLEALESLLTDVGRASSLPGAVKARAALAKARGDDNQVECQACYGKGFNDVDAQVAERESDVQTFRETCEVCDGTGKVSAGGAA